MVPCPTAQISTAHSHTSINTHTYTHAPLTVWFLLMLPLYTCSVMLNAHLKSICSAFPHKMTHRSVQVPHTGSLQLCIMWSQLSVHPALAKW